MEEARRWAWGELLQAGTRAVLHAVSLEWLWVPLITEARGIGGEMDDGTS
jgi:hypothetical protein